MLNKHHTKTAALRATDWSSAMICPKTIDVARAVVIGTDKRRNHGATARGSGPN